MHYSTEATNAFAGNARNLRGLQLTRVRLTRKKRVSFSTDFPEYEWVNYSFRRNYLPVCAIIYEHSDPPTPETKLAFRVVRKVRAFVNYGALSGDFNFVFGVRGARKLWQTPVNDSREVAGNRHVQLALRTQQKKPFSRAAPRLAGPLLRENATFYRQPDEKVVNSRTMSRFAPEMPIFGFSVKQPGASLN